MNWLGQLVKTREYIGIVESQGFNGENIIFYRVRWLFEGKYPVNWGNPYTYPSPETLQEWHDSEERQATWKASNNRK